MKPNNKTHLSDMLEEEIKFSRQKSLKHKRPYPPEKLKKPVTYWIKEDRLMNGKGKALTIILRTRGCSWALKHGGCSMCGYIEDANIEPVEPELIIKQFDFALDNSLEQINNGSEKYILKIFNSGSFFDDEEIPEHVRTHIYERLAVIPNITEFVVESRTEYITNESLIPLKEILPKKYTEIGIGLESVDDHVRNGYIHKGMPFGDFLNAVEICHKNDIGIKTYLLFKSPFLNEKAAIDDCVTSLNKLMEIPVETVSVNPCNVQRGSFVEYLWYNKRYRPPWFYSLFTCFQEALQDTSMDMRILCEPSGAGTERGIHNCHRSQCNENMSEKLKNFVLSQDLAILTQKSANECVCKKKYELKLSF